MDFRAGLLVFLYDIYAYETCFLRLDAVPSNLHVWLFVLGVYPVG